MDLYIRYGYIVDDYLIRFVREPKPIITVDLIDDPDYQNLTIEGINTKSECELHPILHLAILKRAVQLAEIARLKQPDTEINQINY